MTAPTPDVEAAMERVEATLTDGYGVLPGVAMVDVSAADLTLILAQAREAAGLREAASSGIAAIDAAFKACPVGRGRRSIPTCPKCGATSSDGCGPAVAATYDLEASIRRALTAAEKETPND